MIRCRECETLPEPPPDVGSLHLAPMLAPTVEKLLALLKRSGIAVNSSGDGVLSVAQPEGGLAKLVLDLAGVLTPAELRDIPCLVTVDGACDVTDLVRTSSLARLVGRVRGEWVRQMLAEDRFVTHFQPIVE